MTKEKIIRITTVPRSLGGLLRGQLKFMTRSFDIVGISSSDNGRLDKVAHDENIRVIPLEMTRRITPIKDIRAVIQLYRILKKEKPLIVHSHTPKAGTVGMIAAKLAGVPHRLHTIAGLPLVEATGIKRWLLNSVEKLTYSCATKIYPNSFGLEKIILEHGFTKPEKLKVLANGSSNGIDMEHFDPSLFTIEQKETLKKITKIKREDFVFVYVGRFVTDKGINELIAAFTEINKSYSNTKLLLVGNYEKELDPILPESEDLIDKHSNIIAVGWKIDVRPYFAIADVLLFPSYREGFPNVVMQAGAMGLYSAVTDINGCNEIIIEGENGTIFPPKDTTALIKVMEDILNKKNTSVYDSEKIRELIANRYDQKMIWKTIEAEYQTLIVQEKNNQ
ncbi:Capsular polysaccharide biosynthesis glycosyltransferase CapM [Flagellimonas maritima]|uniref:Capsular polysaccharide biosynthesis glycosyltransferase CapM n=1 Tax=Flagellimonas maritima TaxID=1383885 RepID=A0A2Z4LVS4_9FLAO|nr:glycosyltransferase family 4 protein [Allomuricauda aurantiaca]AWX45800.1 Capsular polysaccharide biosynthesis glycosyltransferase CapM [Allomuricauda aurantiaca]